MGATAWQYSVPYDDDVGRALQNLRDEVFRTGTYYRARPDVDPASIEQLLELNDESGSHSVLDVFSVAARPQLGAVAPLPSEELVELFGTDHPTLAHIERNRDALTRVMLARGRWSGSYVVIYSDDAPAEILFFGQSGD